MKYTNFNLNWKTDPLFESWLLADPKSMHSFKYKVCQSALDLGNMGRWALVKHKSAKHIENVEELSSASARTLLYWTSLVTKNGESNSNANSINSGVTGSTSETIIVQNDNAASTSNPLQNWNITDVLRGEIYFSMSHSVKHHTFNSSKHSGVLFETMFPDSKIAKQFACGP